MRTAERTIPMNEKMTDRFDFAEEDGEVYVYTVTDEDSSLRLDYFVSQKSSSEDTPLSRSQAARLCLEGRVLIHGRPDTKNARMKPGDTVQVFMPAPVPDKLEPEHIPLDIVFEDSDIVVINKPSGMVVHPAPGHPTGTLCSALLYHCGSSLSGIGGVSRPGIVHRIDKDTSGLLVVAKNDMAHTSLAAQIKEHSARRTYFALLVGNPKEDSGCINLPIGRHPVDRKSMAVITDGSGSARDAVTHWRILERYPGFCLAECVLETGRTHQIRVHMAHTGHPVLGDPLYGGQKNRFYDTHEPLFEGQCLHAGKLELVHPRSGKKMVFECPMPENMNKIIELLRNLQ